MIGLILCAGLGTRLKEETRDKPKCMVIVENKPVLERIADHLNKNGIDRIVVNLHMFPEVVMKHFGQRFMYLYEPIPMGEFATISLVKSWFPNDGLIVMNGDTLTDVDLKHLSKNGISRRLISSKTERHMGTTIVYDNSYTNTSEVVDCEYFDCGTPEKLKLAREYYDKRS